MISGFLTPQEKTDFTYPNVLYEELLKETGTYIINVRISGREINIEEQLNDFIDEIAFCTRKRLEAMKILWSKYSPDFFMIVFNCLDKIQHKFWKFMDIENPLYYTTMAEKARPKLFEVYQLVDDVIGYILKTMDENTTLYIISDHGFGPLEKRVLLNKWLAQQGLMSLKKGKAYLNKLLYWSGLRKVSFFSCNIGVFDNPVDHCIDFTKTLFFSSDVYEQGVYFNQKAEQVQQGNICYEEELSRLKEKILALRDPTNGELFVDEVCFREDIYWGPHVKQAPDLVLRMMDYGYLLNKCVPLRGDDFLREVKGPNGCHRSEGIFAAYGKNIDQHRGFEASIMDITPTILYNLDIPVPKDMDGKVLKEIFVSDFQNMTNLRYSEEGLSACITETKETGYSEKDEREIRSHLKELGYFD